MSPRLWFLGAVLGVSTVGCSTAPEPVPAQQNETSSAPSSSAASAVPYQGLGSATDPACPAPNPSTPGRLQSQLQIRSICGLPAEVGQVWQRVSSGGKVSTGTGGAVYENANQKLPKHERGYYRQYAVPTPGTKDRGNKWLITGRGNELYYTDNRFQSFLVVDPNAVDR